MIIKKYVADTEAEALDAAKKELGTGIVTMNVRSIKRKGLSRIFKNPLKEVTVALEEENEKISSGVKDIARVVRESGLERKEVEMPSSFSTIGKQTKFQDVMAKEEEKKEVETVATAVKEKVPAVKTETKSVSGIERMASLNAQAKGTPDDKLEEKIDSIQSLLKESLERGDKAEGEDEQKESKSAALVKLLYRTMIQNEIDERYANQLIDELDTNSKGDIPIDYYLSSVYQKMILKFGKASVIEANEKGCKTVFFVGPTGVGKTTTIAKIASKFKLEEKKKIALVTTDTYRIAAAEQLRTYANILTVPFRVIYTEEEFESALRDFADYDYILVDTAGHSHKNDEQKNALAGFLNLSQEKEVYLVISATTKYRDMISIADSYTAVTDYKLIFTKLDETETLGNLLNLRMHTGAEMSYVTNGQNVPEDIAPFDPQGIVKQLLGGNR